MSAAQQRTDARSARDDRVDRITDRLSQLLEPSTTVEQQWVRVHVGPCIIGPATQPRPFDVRCAVCGHVLAPGGGQRLEPRPHVLDRPSLVEQLEAAVGGGTAGRESSGGHESKPAANIEALNVLSKIDRGARFWIEVFTGRPAEQVTGSTAGLLRAVGELFPAAGYEDLVQVDRDVLRWWASARVTTTWDTAPIKPHVPCMSCDRFGGLQVCLDPMTAVCLHCDAAWDSSTIGILGEHIRIAMDARPLRIPDAAPGPWPPEPDPAAVGHGSTPWRCACHDREHFPARLAAACEERSGWVVPA